MKVTDIRQSEDFRAVVMVFSESFYIRNSVTGSYGMLGYLALIHNPIMSLSDSEYYECLCGMETIKRRLSDTVHTFHSQLMGSLLKAHIIDLHDIHSRKDEKIPPSSRPAALMRKFIDILEGGDYVGSRTIAYYAERLCISPPYLSEVCRMMSGQPATFWIDRFVMLDALRRLREEGRSLSEIAYALNFSSVSHLSSFIKRHTGFTPTELQRPH